MQDDFLKQSKTTSNAFFDGLIDGLSLAAGTSDQQARVKEFRDTYRDDPVAFWHDIIAYSNPTPYQEDILSRLVSERRVAVRGPHGLGKSHMASIAVWWFILTHPMSKVPTTASGWHQLTFYLWPEIHKVSRNLNWTRTGYNWNPDWLQLRQIKMAGMSDWTAFAIASADYQRMEGAHAPALLFNFDEAKAIPAETFDAIEGAFSAGDCYAMAISTPGAPSGRFYDIHQRKPGYEDWWIRHVTLDEAVSSGRINPEWVDARRNQWGETSSLFQNRVLGEFSTEDEESVIPLAWVELAQQRYQDHYAPAYDGDTGQPADAPQEPSASSDDQPSLQADTL